MKLSKRIFTVTLCVIIVLAGLTAGWAGQVWTKCHITCRCLQTSDVGNFMFVIPLDVTPDIGFEADMACKAYGARVCPDCCNGTKYSFTYKVTSP